MSTLIQNEMCVDIKMVCISGDLINSVYNADVELDTALESFATFIGNIYSTGSLEFAPDILNATT